MIFSWNLGLTVSLILKKIYFCGQNIVSKKLHRFFVCVLWRGTTGQDRLLTKLKRKLKNIYQGKKMAD